MENKSHVPKHRSLIIHDYLYIVTMIYKTPTRKGLKNALPLTTHDVSHGFPTVFPSCFPWFSHGFPMVFPTPGSAVGSACTQPSFNICCRSSKRRGAKSPRLVISSFLATELEVLLEVPWEKNDQKQKHVLTMRWLYSIMYDLDTDLNDMYDLDMK